MHQDVEGGDREKEDGGRKEGLKDRQTDRQITKFYGFVEEDWDKMET